jgi:uncharacterized membrane protein
MESITNTNVVQVVQFIAVLLTGLLAGAFYGYDCSLIKAFVRMPDNVYLQSFQAINSAIQNPYFFTSFMGSLLAFPLATFTSYKNADASFYLLLAATVLYAAGVFGVTVFGNVPLNERLAKFPIATAAEHDLAAMRQLFENTWNKYHRIRTVASIAAFALTIVAILKQKI